MSLDIDMESYGRSFNEPAAETQTQVESNSYLQEDGEYVHKEFLENPASLETQEDTSLEKPPETSTPQADNFRALREEVDRLKSEREVEKREHSLQMELWKANQRQETPQKMPERKAFEGMEKDDVPNVGEITREWEIREASYRARLEELQIQQAHPDYEEVLTKYVRPLVEKNPDFIKAINAADNKALFAYELGMMAKQRQQEAVPQAAPVQSKTAQRIVENAARPGTLSQAGGQASLSKADYYATMSDAEFSRLASKNLDGI